MSGTYEIHTSISEELILEELRQMKKKFMPAGPSSANRFTVLVLPPAHQGGRRRAGGFVQLAGNIMQQGDKNCIQVKTRSGVSFIVSMTMVVFLAFVLAGAVLAGNWTLELLFPAGFLLVFSIALFYMRKRDAIAAEKILRERFEGTDRITEFHYKTHYTKEQCLEFMKHENASDIYEYEWREEKTFGALIIRNYKKPDFVHDFVGRQEWGFIVRFREEEGNTLIETQLVQTEKLPFIHNKQKIDEFFENKLGAALK